LLFVSKYNYHKLPGGGIDDGEGCFDGSHLLLLCFGGPADPGLQEALAECALIVQCTPVGMEPHRDDRPLAEMNVFSSEQIVFDLIYRPRETRFLRDARTAGAVTIDGLDMFLHQAASSFELWTGTTPPLATIRPILEEKLLP